MFLPMFPDGSKMINGVVAVNCELDLPDKKGKWYHYWYNGAPIFFHAEDDLASFRYIVSHLIVMNLVTIQEVCTCFELKADSVRKQVKRLREGGAEVFYNRNRSENQCYKIRGTLLLRLQEGLDLGKSNSKLAKEEGLSEGSIRAAIKRGVLKKK